MNTRLAMHRFCCWWLALFACACAGASAQAQTPSPLHEVRSLVQAGKLPEASKEIARQLQRPDPEPGLQLLQCVVQAQQNQTDKAIACLSALVKQRPDMLEAYNNLGVLHASRGQTEEARRWLTLALQRQPGLWTLHQNLQSLQADMARKAYARALQTELPLKETPPKLTMLATTSLINAPVAQAAKAFEAPMLPTAPTAPTVPTAPTAPTVPTVPTVPTAKAKEPSPTPPLQPATTPSAQADNRQKAPLASVTTPHATGSATKDKAIELDNTTRQQLQDTVQAWAQAWSAQNMSAYFAAYTPGYTPGKAISRAAWESERNDRIAGREFVRVKVSNFSFENTGTKVIARFNQLYVSGSIQSTHRKRLELVQLEGQWKIARETVISN